MKFEIKNQTDTLPPPAAMICRECSEQIFAHPHHDGVLVIHCGHFECGAIYSRKTRMWKLYTPISREKFFAGIVAGIEKFAEHSEAMAHGIQ